MTQNENKPQIGLVGFGNQGKAWASNLKDGGWDVFLFHRPDRQERYRDLPFETRELGPSLKEMSHVALLIPDDAIPLFWKSYGKHFTAGQSILLAHGFAYHFKTVPWPEDIHLLLLAPKAIGPALREKYLNGDGVASVVSVFRGPKTSLTFLKTMARALGCKPHQIVEGSVSDEVEADLFSEQALQCGGLPALVEATYNTLIENGIHPKIAYLECVHELQYMAKLFADKGIYQTLQMASPTAKFGGSKGAKKILSKNVRETLNNLFRDVRNGSFLRELEMESKQSYPETNQALEDMASSRLEKTGTELRLVKNEEKK